MALKRQEELIREEEAAGVAETEKQARKEAAEKEKRSKKKLVRFVEVLLSCVVSRACVVDIFVVSSPNCGIWLQLFLFCFFKEFTVFLFTDFLLLFAVNFTRLVCVVIFRFAIDRIF